MVFISNFIAGISVLDLLIAAIASGITFALVYHLLVKRSSGRVNRFLIHSLMNEQSQYIAFFDFSGRIIQANKSFEDLVGLSESQLIGCKIDDLPVANDISFALLRSNEKLLEDRSVTVTYTQLIKKNKEDHWLDIQKRTLVLDDPKNTYILLVATDVSDKKRVEERLTNTQDQYKQLVEAAGDIIYQTDLAGRITYINSVVEKMLGYSEDEARNMNIQDFIVGDDAQAFNDFISSAFDNIVSQSYQEFRAKTNTGEIIWLGQVVSVIKDGKQVVGFHGVARDVTSQKIAEEKLKRARNIAEEASEAKSNFISSMSHELRTPLNAILGYSQIMERNETLLNDEKEHIQEIKSAGEQLLGMVNDILELSVLDARNSNINFDEILIQPYMESISQRFSSLAEEKGLSFIFNPPTVSNQYLLGDFDKISQVLKNLLENAVKFTPQGAVTFSYSFKEVEEKAGLLECIITDTGVGINKEDEPKIFQPFWQKKPLTNSGTGLGLTLCQRLVSVLDGKIQIQSGAIGTEVQLSIPVKFPMKQDQNIEISDIDESPVRAITGSKKPKILIVDDLAPNRTITRIILSERGYDYAEAEDGQEGIDLLSYFDADVILMDINMPVMDGLEAMLKIRSRDWQYRNIPIIAVTAGVKESKNELLMSGFSDYIQKPFRESELLTAIDAQLKRKVKQVVRNYNPRPSIPAPKENKRLSAEEVGSYIYLLEHDKRAELERIMRIQNFEKIKELELLYTVTEKEVEPEFMRLVQAANEFDYLFVSRVLRALRREESNHKV